MDKNKEKLLLAGGLGFVGKNLIEKMSDEYQIIVIDKNIDNDFVSKTNIIFYQFSFNDQNQLNDIIDKEKPDYIINLISIVTAERDLDLFDKLYDVNFKIFLSLSKASINTNLKLFVNFGTAEEYGPIAVPFSEKSREYPSSPYALIKQLTTNTALMLNSNYDFPVCVVRPANLFGKYQDEKKVIPYIIEKLSNNHELLLSPGEQKRDFIHIDDFIIGIRILLKNYPKTIGNIINIGSGQSYSIKYIVEYLRKKLKSISDINYGFYAYRRNEMMDFCLDNSYINEISNNQFIPDLHIGLDKLLGEVI